MKYTVRVTYPRKASMVFNVELFCAAYDTVAEHIWKQLQRIDRPVPILDDNHLRNSMVGDIYEVSSDLTPNPAHLICAPIGFKKVSPDFLQLWNIISDKERVMAVYKLEIFND